MVRRPPNINNLAQIFSSFEPEELGLTRTEYALSRSRLMGQELSYSEENLNSLARKLPKGSTIKSRIKRARYDWLFDDLQEFTSEDFATLQSTKDFQSVLKNIMPNQSDATVAKLAIGLNQSRLRDFGQPRPSRGVVRVTTQQGLNDAVRLVGRAKSAKLVSLANKENLFRRGDDLIVRTRNNKGRVQFRDFKTGRFTKNPLK